MMPATNDAIATCAVCLLPISDGTQFNLSKSFSLEQVLGCLLIRHPERNIERIPLSCFVITSQDKWERRIGPCAHKTCIITDRRILEAGEAVARTVLKCRQRTIESGPREQSDEIRRLRRIRSILSKYARTKSQSREALESLARDLERPWT